MNRLLLLIYFLSFSLTLFCQKNDVSDKSIREIFNAYKDIPKSADDYGIFWQFIQNNNKNYNKYLNDNSKLAKQTRSEFKERLALLKGLVGLKTHLLTNEVANIGSTIIGIMTYRKIR